MINVVDTQGNPAMRRVRLHRMDTGAVIGESVSNGLGRCSISVDYAGQAYAVVLDDRAGVVEEMKIRRVVL